MLKLNASYSKKVPVEGQDYSSQSYHCSVDVEIPDGLTPHQLQAKIHSTFGLVRDSVEAELHNGHAAHSSEPFETGMANDRARSAANTNGPSRGAADPRASGKQIKFLTDLALQCQMDVRTLNGEAHRQFGVDRVEDLTRKQASEMIDLLNGGTRGNNQRRAA
jgi:hypothetical protein